MNSGFFRLNVVFDSHVLEFASLKNIATFLAFKELNAFFSGNNPHARMPTDFLHSFHLGDGFAIRRFGLGFIFASWRP